MPHTSRQPVPAATRRQEHVVDDLPSDWQTLGSAPATDPAAAGRPRPSLRAGIPRNGVLLAAALVAVGLAGAAVVGATWLASPSGSLTIDGAPIASAAPIQHPAGGVAVGSPRATAASSNRETDLVVDVEGGVRSPGVHHLPRGSRVGDAIGAAGGFASRADLAAIAQSLNLAAPVEDGAKIRIPQVGDAPGASSGPVASPAGQPGATGLVDLNHADETALEALPGIGPVTAGKIIAARATSPFGSVDDLQTRDVLGATTLAKIRDLVTVSP